MAIALSLLVFKLVFK